MVFTGQHAIADYVVDFYCYECRLLIELDGNFHTGPDVKEYDQLRTALLNELGITVLRFWNEEAIRDPEKVLRKIPEHLH